jgi:alkaline phosphatase
MKNKFLFLTTLIVFLALFAQGQAKYVFLIIGDGMGLNQINGTEMYLAELEGNIGFKPLLFTQFPNAGLLRTHSASNGVTDSAAAGTALATGSKTKNGTIGMDTLFNPVYSVAVKARNAGKKVGILTSCGLDDATPAAFYAHQTKRNMQYEIAIDASSSRFDFFGGATFTKPYTRSDGSLGSNVYTQMEKEGYVLAYGFDEYKEKSPDADRIILMERKEKKLLDLVYAIDRQETDLSLAQLTEAAVEHLSRDNQDGFFLMVEGGTIDMACHANDAATTFAEIIDLDESVKIAYDFYQRHPEETLIIVTADHETGGMVLGAGSSRLNLQVLQHQKMSQMALSSRIVELREQKKNKVSWENIKSLLSETMGFWDKVTLTAAEEEQIREVYKISFVEGDTSKVETLYQKDEKISVAANKIINKKANVGWMSSGHSAGFVPVFAIGAGAESFNSLMDNTQLSQKILEVADF